MGNKLKYFAWFLIGAGVIGTSSFLGKSNNQNNPKTNPETQPVYETPIETNNPDNQQSKLEKLDINGDGLEDFILSNQNDYVVFIQRKDRTYDRCEEVLSEGIPFYRTLDGKRIYTIWNQVLDENIKVVKE